MMVDEEEGETGLQEDIVVYKRIYNPDPRVCEYWFEEWGSGYWTRSGVDFIVHINADGTISVDEQLTGDTYVDEDTEEEFDIYVQDVVSFNAEAFLPEFCSSTFDATTKTGTIWPAYYWYPDPSSSSVTGYFGIYPDDTAPMFEQKDGESIYAARIKWDKWVVAYRNKHPNWHRENICKGCELEGVGCDFYDENAINCHWWRR